MRIRNDLSTPRNLALGIPQGTCLGPLLFLTYINDLPRVSSKFCATLFADDTTLSFSGAKLSDLTLIVNSELDKFSEWSVANRLSINVEKTCLNFITNGVQKIN